jgi:hypothetical protein
VKGGKKKSRGKKGKGRAAGEDAPGSTLAGDRRADELFPEDGFDDSDSDTAIDPALSEQLDREVEEFARRLAMSYSH